MLVCCFIIVKGLWSKVCPSESWIHIDATSCCQILVKNGIDRNYQYVDD